MENWFGLLRLLATRRSLDYLRKRIRRKARSQEIPDWSRVSSPAGNPGQQAEETESARLLGKALGKLPSRQAEVLCLRYMDEMDDREIARQLGIRQSTVRVVAHRGRARLGRLLAAVR